MVEYKEKRKAISFTHRILWQNGCLKQKEIADQKKPGYISFNLTAMLFAFMSFEAYLNFIGEIIFADNKMEFFYKKKSYRSFNSKFELIRDKCKINLDKEQRPYKTIQSLKVLRNFLAHGTIKKNEYEVKYKDNELPPPQRTYLASLVQTDAMLIALEDVKAICDLIHKQVKSFSDHPDLGPDALEGMLGFEFGSTEIVP